MRPKLWMSVLVCLLTLSLATAEDAFADTMNDGAAVRALATRQADAWNRHDAKAYADLFTRDCDVVNLVGAWWNGRDELERKLSAAYATVFKDSALTFTDVQVRFLTPLLAIVHMRWTMTGAKPLPGFAQAKQGIQTLVLQKQAGEWLIDAFQNTNTVSDGAPAAKSLPLAPTPVPTRSTQ